MAKSLNKIQLIGNLGKDPEIKSIPSGAQLCRVSLATTDRYKDRNGEWQENTDWHTVVFWERLAEIAAEYLKKGSRVYVEGNVKYRSFEGQDGNTVKLTEIRASNMIMLDSKGSTPGGGGYVNDSGPQEQDYNQPDPEEHLGGSDLGSQDDDVPF